MNGGMHILHEPKEHLGYSEKTVSELWPNPETFKMHKNISKYTKRED